MVWALRSERLPSQKAIAPASRSRPNSEISSALAALGERRHRQYAHPAGVAGAAQHEIDDRRIVDRRRGAGRGDDGGDAAGRGRSRGGGDGLAMLGSGLADEGLHVDEAGREHIAGAIDDSRALRRAVGRHAGAEIGDLSIEDEKAAACLHAGGGVDEAGVDEKERRMRRHGRLIRRFRSARERGKGMRARYRLALAASSRLANRTCTSVPSAGGEARRARNCTLSPAASRILGAAAVQM